MSGLQIIKAALHAGMLSLMFSVPDNIYISKTQSDMETQGQTCTSRNDNSEINVEILHPGVGIPSTAQGDHTLQQCISTKKHLCMVLVPP